LRYTAAVATQENLDCVEAWERGVLLGVFAMDADEAVINRFEGARGERCATAWRALLRMDEDARAARLECWRKEAASALPAGIERLHPSWIDEVLAGEPARIVRALCAALPAGIVGRLKTTVAAAHVDRGADARLPEAAERDLCRVALAHLFPLCEGEGGRLAEELGSLEPEELLAEITRLGARTLGRSLVGQAASVRARIMAAAGEPWAVTIAEGSTERISSEERKAALVAASRPVPAAVRTMRDRLLHIGLIALRAELAAEAPGSLSRVLGRLPVELGRRLLAC